MHEKATLKKSASSLLSSFVYFSRTRSLQRNRATRVEGFMKCFFSQSWVLQSSFAPRLKQRVTPSSDIIRALPPFQKKKSKFDFYEGGREREREGEGGGEGREREREREGRRESYHPISPFC